MLTLPADTPAQNPVLQQRHCATPRCMTFFVPPPARKGQEVNEIEGPQNSRIEGDRKWPPQILSHGQPSQLPLRRNPTRGMADGFSSV